jgi:penicillin-binding protein 1A
MSHRLRQQRRRRHRGGLAGKLLLAFAVLLTVGLIGLLAAVGYVAGIAASAPSISSLKPINQGFSSQIYAANGRRLGFIQSAELHSPVPDKDIPRALKQATVAIEDQRFYKHHGVDLEGIVRAAFKNLESGKSIQGGSTITMQLVRNLYITPERTFKRKIREAKLAQQLEKRHDKGWILDKYLNTVSYGTVGGQTAVGVQAAARTFFDKKVSELDLPQVALLAGLPQAPSEYNPFRDGGAARARRNEVLRKMAQLKMITPGEAADASLAPLGVKQGHFYTARRESYFFDYVQDELIRRYGVNEVRKGGLKVYTTIDLNLQRFARKAMAGQLNQPGDPASAIVAIDPRNGYIKAMTTSQRYDKSKFNLAAQGHRQAGSTFKVMVLMTALRRKINPATTYYVSKQLAPGWLKTAPTYGVQTYGHSYSGSINLVSATLKSDNTVYAQLDADLGPQAVKKTAEDMGITTKLDGYPAEGLGGLTRGVSPLELANAYATIASGGWRNRPIAITKVVKPDGSVDTSLGKIQRTKVFEDGITAEATKILEMNVKAGTGTAAQIGCPAAGKTGTVDDFTDAWFVGFTPHLTASVWVGYPNAKVPMTNVHGIQVNGGSFPAQIWHDFMATAKGRDCSDFPPPKEAISFQPFFGHYASTGAPVTDTGGQPYDKNKKGKQKKGGGVKGGNPYDPNFYESPPQGAPNTQAPANPGQGQGQGTDQGTNNQGTTAPPTQPGQ